MNFLFDTNHAVALLNGDARILGRLTSRVRQGDAFAITTITVGELLFGAYRSQRVEENRRRVHEQIIPRFVLLAFDLAAADEFGKVLAELRAKGRPIPTADAQIAAIARLHEYTVLSGDEHFGFVDRLHVENWLGT